MEQDLGASDKSDRATAAEPVVSALRDGIPSADWAGNDFARGAQVCREMMARFVEQGGDPIIAGSIRANWHPGWGDDPGVPPYIIDTWEAPECPEGEASYAAFCKEVAGDPDHQPDLTPEGLGQTVRMLETWAIPMLPANRLGQVPMLRAMIESAIRDLRAAAQAIEARRAATTGAVHESAVGATDAPHTTPESSQ